MSEPKVKQYLVDCLQDSFELVQEQTGVDPITGEKGRIDFLAYPKGHLIDRGFVPQWFGVECKYKDEFSGSAINMLFAQAVTYRRMIFNGVGLPFVFIFSNEQVYKYTWRKRAHVDQWITLLNSYQYLHIGELRIEKDHWALRFGHMNSPYFDSKTMARGHGNHGLAMYVGNATQKRQLITDHIEQRYYAA